MGNKQLIEEYRFIFLVCRPKHLSNTSDDICYLIVEVVLLVLLAQMCLALHIIIIMFYECIPILINVYICFTCFQFGSTIKILSAQAKRRPESKERLHCFIYISNRLRKD